MRSVLFLMPMLLLGAEGSVDQARIVGLSGKWTIDKGDVHLETKVRPGDPLRAKTDATIVLQCGNRLVTQRCRTDKCVVRACESKEASDSYGFLPATARLLRRNPDRFVLALSRNLGPEAWEALLPLHAGELNLAPVFKALPQGTYEVKILSLPGAPAFSAGARVQWIPGGSAPATVNGLKPGVYKLTIENGPGDAQDQDAWIGIIPESASSQAKVSWQQAENAASGWREDVEPGQVHAFLRAALVAILEPAAAADAK